MSLHSLNITVIDGGKADTSNSGAEADADGAKKLGSKKKSNLYKFLNLNQTVKGKIKQATSPTQFFAIQSGVSLATQSAKQFINYYVSDIGRANGDSNYQAIVNRGIEQVTDGLSLGQGALTGAASGSAFGVPGAILGALFGVASSGASLGFKYADRGRTYQHEMFTESSSQAYNLARAGNTALTGRLR